MTVRIGSIDVVDTNNSTVLQAAIQFEAGAFYGDDYNDAAAFSVTIPNNSTGASTLAEGRYLRFKMNGSPDRTGLIERIQRTVVSTRPNELVWEVTGRDWLAEFDDAVVDPPLGTSSVPQATLVRFDWTHPQLDLTGWTAPVYVGPTFAADQDPLGNPMDPPMGGKFGANPEGWPDVFTSYIWSAALDANNSHVTGKYSYFAANYTLTSGMFVPFFTADDQGQLAFDGAVVDSGAESPTPQWLKCTASGIPQVSAGTHYIRIRAINDPTYGVVNSPGTGASNNPGAIAFVCYQNILDTTLQEGNVRARSASATTGSNYKQGGADSGGWKCLHAPASAPGFTPGKAFRLLFDAAQAQGFLPGWTLGFTDTNDSNGNAWAVTDALSARVNDDTLLDVLRSWAAQGYIDFAARASTRVLDLYRWRERGNFWTSPGSPLVWDGDNVSRVVVTGRR